MRNSMEDGGQGIGLDSSKGSGDAYCEASTSWSDDLALFKNAVGGWTCDVAENCALVTASKFIVLFRFV